MASAFLAGAIIEAPVVLPLTDTGSRDGLAGIVYMVGLITLGSLCCAAAAFLWKRGCYRL